MPTDQHHLTQVDRRGYRIDDAVALYEHVYSSTDINIGDAAQEGFSYRYRVVGDDQLVLGTSAVAARRWGTIDAGHEYVMAWASGPGITLDTDSADPIEMQPGVPVMYPSGRAFAFDALPTTQHVIRFDGRFLESVAAAHRGGVPGALRFARHPHPDDLRRLRRVIADLASTLLDPSSDQAARSAANAAVAEAVVAAFDATPVVGLTVSDGPASMRFAQEWIVANAARALTITDIAGAAGISARTLQASFQAHVGIPPLEFLRRVRLHRIRAELLAASPDATTVAAVARRWGVGHLGRFSGSYEKTFGELPSSTLRRR